MKVNIRLAGCIILDKQGRILLLHRNTDKRQQWEIPGGKIEPGETPKDTAVRELKEELGVDVEIIKMLGSKEFIEDGHPMHYTWFLAEITHGVPAIMEPEKFDKSGYFTKEGSLNIYAQLSPNTQNYLTATNKVLLS